MRPCRGFNTSTVNGKKKGRGRIRETYLKIRTLKNVRFKIQRAAERRSECFGNQANLSDGDDAESVC